MKFIGIDPGKEGAIVVLDENSIIVEKAPIPLIGKEINIVGLKNILLKYSDSLLMDNEKVIVGVERVHAIYGSSASSTFTFGFGCGVIEGILSTLKLPYYKFQPKEWQKFCFTGIPIQKKQISNGNDTKLMAKHAVNRLYPDVDLRASDRCKNFHSGIVDALLIAHYLKNFYNNK